MSASASPSIFMAAMPIITMNGIHALVMGGQVING